MRFQWDIYDSVNDADGDSVQAGVDCFSCPFSILYFYASGTLVNQIDEPWLPDYSAIDNYDGRGSSSYSFNYNHMGFGNVEILRTDNCTPPMSVFGGIPGIIRGLVSWSSVSARLIVFTCLSVLGACGAGERFPRSDAGRSDAGRVDPSDAGGAQIDGQLSSTAGDASDGELADAAPSVGAVEAGSANDGGNANPRVCDGSDRVRLGILLSGQLGDNFQEVQIELGSPYVYVDGKCNYWAAYWSMDRFSLWQPIRSGVLTAEEEAAFEALARYDDFVSWKADCSRPTMLSDAPAIELFDGSAQVACPQDAPAMKGFFDRFRAMAVPLYERGSLIPPKAGLRVEVGYTHAPVNDVPPHPWPLKQPIMDFVISGNAERTGVSRLVTDPADVSALLALRDSYEQEQANQVKWDFGIRIDGDYILFFREQLPITNDRGLLP